MKIICLDIGATKILMSVVKLRRQKFVFLEIEEKRNPKKEEKIKEIILTYCGKARIKYWTKRVAFSAAYVVDPEKKFVSQGRSCYGTDRFDLNFLERAGFSVRVENDGRCFGLGEYFFGKGKNAATLFSMTLGTNIGGGFMSRGYTFRGAHQSAMEISYLNFFYEKRWQDWDNFCAGEGIEKSYKQATGKSLTAKDIFLRDSRGELEARKTISFAASVLGMGIANILNILDPELVIFGGSVSKQKNYLKKAVEIAKKNKMNKKANYKFAISTLGNKANLLGAATLYK